MLASTRTIKQIKAMIAKFLHESCDLLRQSDTVDDYGNQVNSWTVIASGVACRVITEGSRSTGSQTRQVGEQEAIVERYRLIVPAGTALGVDMRVRHGGHDYAIVDVADRLTDKVDAQALMVRVRDE